MYSSDKPIIIAEDDKLNRADFAKHLADAIGYQFKKDDYEQYIPTDKIMNAINEVRFSDTFWQLPTKTIEKVASFAYHKENPKIDDFEMKSEYISQLINTWQQQYDDYKKVE